MAKDLVTYGIYPDRASFERALEALRTAGFRNSDISAIASDRDTDEDLAADQTKARKASRRAPAGAAGRRRAGLAVGVARSPFRIGPLVAPVLSSPSRRRWAPVPLAVVGGLVGADPEVEASMRRPDPRRRLSRLSALRRFKVGKRAEGSSKARAAATSSRRRAAAAIGHSTRQSTARGDTRSSKVTPMARLQLFLYEEIMLALRDERGLSPPSIESGIAGAVLAELCSTVVLSSTGAGSNSSR
jgi:hypothetical protein